MSNKFKNHNFNKFVYSTLLLLTLISCLFAFIGERQSTRKLTERIDRHLVEQIMNQQQITVGRAIKNEDNVFVMATKRHIVTGDKIKTLKKILLNDKNYTFDLTKKCLFAPEAVFQFQNDEQSSLMINLFCNQIKFIDGDKSIILDYDPVAEEFNAFCRDILEHLDKEE